MFVGKSVAEFEVDGKRAQLIIDSDMPVSAVQAILNKLVHFCVERLKDAEREEAQRLQDEEAAKPPVLEEAPAEESEVVVEEEAKPVEE